MLQYAYGAQGGMEYDAVPMGVQAVERGFSSKGVRAWYDVLDDWWASCAGGRDAGGGV